jgi:hypothetical protein
VTAGDAIPPASHQALALLADWSPWVPLVNWPSAPRLPGVYVARQGEDGALVYVGMAGERHGHGIQGRLRVYASGKAAVSGLGEAALDRALADKEWLMERLAEVERGEARRATSWAAAALTRADLQMAWATVETPEQARVLERQVLDALSDESLWNRLR